MSDDSQSYFKQISTKKSQLVILVFCLSIFFVLMFFLYQSYLGVKTSLRITNLNQLHLFLYQMSIDTSQAISGKEESFKLLKSGNRKIQQSFNKVIALQSQQVSTIFQRSDYLTLLKNTTNSLDDIENQVGMILKNKLLIEKINQLFFNIKNQIEEVQAKNSIYLIDFKLKNKDENSISLVKQQNWHLERLLSSTEALIKENFSQQLIKVVSQDMYAINSVVKGMIDGGSFLHLNKVRDFNLRTRLLKLDKDIKQLTKNVDAFVDSVTLLAPVRESVANLPNQIQIFFKAINQLELKSHSSSFLQWITIVASLILVVMTFILIHSLTSNINMMVKEYMNQLDLNQVAVTRLLNVAKQLNINNKLKVEKDIKGGIVLSVDKAISQLRHFFQKMNILVKTVDSSVNETKSTVVKLSALTQSQSKKIQSVFQLSGDIIESFSYVENHWKTSYENTEYLVNMVVNCDKIIDDVSKSTIESNRNIKNSKSCIEKLNGLLNNVFQMSERMNRSADQANLLSLNFMLNMNDSEKNNILSSFNEIHLAIQNVVLVMGEFEKIVIALQNDIQTISQSMKKTALNVGKSSLKADSFKVALFEIKAAVEALMANVIHINDYEKQQQNRMTQFAENINGLKNNSLNITTQMNTTQQLVQKLYDTSEKMHQTVPEIYTETLTPKEQS